MLVAIVAVGIGTTHHVADHTMTVISLRLKCVVLAAEEEPLRKRYVYQSQ